GDLSASLSQGPGTGKSRTDSTWYDYGSSMVGLGYTRSEDSRRKAWSPTETWMYVRYDTPFPSYGVPYYYGPFDWSYIPPKFPYLSKGVTFSNGRVVFFQYLPPPPP